jgi:hypothetical protein
MGYIIHAGVGSRKFAMPDPELSALLGGCLSDQNAIIPRPQSQAAHI